MLEFKGGDILKCEADALVNTVNCVGVMGRGIALQFKNAYPENFEAYAAACKRGEVLPGKMFVHETGQLIPPRFVINFPTKRHWRGKSRLEDIEAGLKALVSEIRSREIRSIAVPPLGSGLGGLDWNSQVRPLVEAILGSLAEVSVYVFEPKGAPASDSMKHRREVPKLTAGRAALVEMMHQYLGGLLDPFVTLLEVHKLMYFMQEAGEPLRLNFVKAHYGPYAENLRHVLHAIEGHLVDGYEDGGDSPDKILSLVPGAVEDASALLAQNTEARERIARVVKLIQGFETSFGMELLSTVHWVIAHGEARTIEEVIQKTYDWNPRKQQFNPRQIRLAVDTLATQGWVDRSVLSATA